MTPAWRAPDPAELTARDRRRRVRDCLAGAGGWVERSRRRVALWPDVIGFARHEHWWLLDDPLSRQWLPAYWTAHV